MKLTKGTDIIKEAGITTLYCPSCAETSEITAFYNKKVKCPECGKLHIILSTLSEKLKEYRELKGCSQVKFSEKYNFSHDSVKNWESGRNKPVIETMKKLNELFRKAGIE